MQQRYWLAKGGTFMVRRELKAAGLLYDAERMQWYAQTEAALAAGQRIVEQNPQA